HQASCRLPALGRANRQQQISPADSPSILNQGIADILTTTGWRTAIHATIKLIAVMTSDCSFISRIHARNPSHQAPCPAASKAVV
ncbi:MAG: hypothetical protein ACK559_06510, partial [bacterium]